MKHLVPIAAKQRSKTKALPIPTPISRRIVACSSHTPVTRERISAPQ